MVKTQDRENQIPLKINPTIWKKIAKYGSHEKTHLYGISTCMLSHIIYLHVCCPTSYTYMYVVPHHIATCMLSHIIYLHVCCPTSYICMYVVPHHISTCMFSHIMYLPVHVCCPTSCIYMYKYVVPHHVSICMLSHIIYLHVCCPTSYIYMHYNRFYLKFLNFGVSNFQ